MKRLQLVLMVIGGLPAWGGGCSAAGGGSGGSGRPSVNQDRGQGDNVASDPDDAVGDSGGVDDDAMVDDGIDRPPVGAASAVVKTRIVIGDEGKIAVGDDLIVYGVGDSDYETNQPAGVHFIGPSKTDRNASSGTMIPNSDVLFGIDDFEVAGRKVALVRSTNEVSIYDTETGNLVDTDVMLGTNVISSQRAMTSDGPFIAAINNLARDFFGGSTVTVIDLSGPEPELVNFPTPDDLFELGDGWWDAVAMDAEARQVAALSSLGDIYVYDLDAPASLPVKFDFVPGTISGYQIRFDGGYVLYEDSTDFAAPRPALLNVSDGTVVRLDEPSSPYVSPISEDVWDVALGGGSFGYFMFHEDADLEEHNNGRNAIGRIADAPSPTLASQFDHYAFRPSRVAPPGSIREECRDPKRVGYARSICIAPDGDRWFLAGSGAVDTYLDYVQVSGGGAFSDIADPEGDTFNGSLMGSDPVCSEDILAFRGLREIHDGGCLTIEEQVVAFIRLDQFED